MPRRLKYPRRVIDTTGVEVVDRTDLTPAELLEAYGRLSLRQRWCLLKELNKLPVTKTERPMMPVWSKPAPPLRVAGAMQGELDPEFDGYGRLRKDRDLTLRKRPTPTSNLIGRVMRGELGRAELRAMARERKDGS